jgi:Tol biopolymer transport system component
MTDAPKLIGLSGDYKDQEFSLKPGENLVGRGEEADPQLLDPRISRAHAHIIIEGATARLADLDSTEGTYLNGDRVTEAALKDGDKLRFGGSVFRLHLPAPETSPQDAIPTVLSSQAAIPTVLSGDDDIPTRLASDASDIPDMDETRVAQGRPAAPPPVTPPPPPPASPTSPQGRAGRSFPWKGFFFGLAAVVVIGVGIMLGVQLLGGTQDAPVADAPAATVAFDAPTPPTSQAPSIPATFTPTAETNQGGPPPSQDDEPTPEAQPTFTDAKEEIAFASDRSGRPQLYLVDLAGGETRQLTDLPDGACQPAWSPDGTTLAFTSPCTSNREEYAGSSIFVLQVGADGSASEPSPLILSLSGGEYDPAWSPDGAKIAFTSLRTGRAQIFVAGADGSNPQNLNSDLAFNWSPAWSPDGTQLAFLTGRGGQEEVWLIPSGGGEETRFTRGDGKDVARPAWSADGETIAFEKVIGNISRLIGAPLADGGVREVQVCQSGALSLQPMGEPAWSPDGTQLVFETWPGGVDHNIATIALGCTGYRELTSDDARDFDPAWRPSP